MERRSKTYTQRPRSKPDDALDKPLYFDNSRYMETDKALSALAALAQETRLAAFRLLIQQEPDGVAAGDLARQLAVPQNTLSTHLALLARAGLVSATRDGRSIRYRANLTAVSDLVLFLLTDCCQGQTDLCGAIIAGLSTSACSPTPCLGETHGTSV